MILRSPILSLRKHQKSRWPSNNSFQMILLSERMFRQIARQVTSRRMASIDIPEGTFSKRGFLINVQVPWLSHSPRLSSSTSTRPWTSSRSTSQLRPVASAPSPATSPPSAAWPQVGYPQNALSNPIRFDDRLRRQHRELLRHLRLVHHQRRPHRLNHCRGGLPRCRHRQGGCQPCPCRRSGTFPASKTAQNLTPLSGKGQQW